MTGNDPKLPFTISQVSPSEIVAWAFEAPRIKLTIELYNCEQLEKGAQGVPVSPQLI